MHDSSPHQIRTISVPSLIEFTRRGLMFEGGICWDLVCIIKLWIADS